MMHQHDIRVDHFTEKLIEWSQGISLTTTIGFSRVAERSGATSAATRLLTPDDLIQPSHHSGQILRRKPCDLISHALD